MNKLTTSLEKLREAPPRIPTGEVEENGEVVNLLVESKPYTKFQEGLKREEGAPRSFQAAIG